jgi:hypothetical protein
MLARKAYAALLLLAVLLAAVLLSFADAARLAAAGSQALTLRREMVAQLGLTDLCLFTEARYTRHLSQADLHSAFQDHPLAFEHFPSGSLVTPPAGIPRAYEKLVREAEVPD